MGVLLNPELVHHLLQGGAPLRQVEVCRIVHRHPAATPLFSALGMSWHTRQHHHHHLSPSWCQAVASDRTGSCGPKVTLPGVREVGALPVPGVVAGLEVAPRRARGGARSPGWWLIPQHHLRVACCTCAGVLRLSALGAMHASSALSQPCMQPCVWRSCQQVRGRAPGLLASAIAGDAERAPDVTCTVACGFRCRCGSGPDNARKSYAGQKCSAYGIIVRPTTDLQLVRRSLPQHPHIC